MPGRPFPPIPGPTPVPERIVRAMSRPIIDRRGPKFEALGIDDGLRHGAHDPLGDERGTGNLEKGPSRHGASLACWCEPPGAGAGGPPTPGHDRVSARSMTRDGIPTPALLLDLDRFERNLARMASHVRTAGKHVRPHAKTHRCPEIARRQIAAGALGVACAKLGEAEGMAGAGIRGLLLTTEIVPPPSIRRLLRLLAEAPDTLVVVDDARNVADLGRAAGAEGHVVNVLVDVDVGGRRPGAQPGAPALAPGRLVAAHPSLRLRGLQVH